MSVYACPVCQDTEVVCENHRDKPWGPMCCTAGTAAVVICEDGACHCGGAGEPCPNCCYADRFARRADFVPGTVATT